ncbi:MAG: hypothetical protein QCI38_04130 [Candidatus Thermoplasmatota archaeon]|nr:hypothetical protein [Candidatus Thermoplasmatota archaeon]
MKLGKRLFRTEEERLEMEDFIKAVAAGFLFLVIFTPLAALFPVIGFNIFLLLIIVPYYAGYQAGKRTDYGHTVGFVLGIMWTAVEFIFLFYVGNMLALTGRVRITTMLEVFILFMILGGNTFACWLGGGVGSRKRFLHRKVDDGTEWNDDEERVGESGKKEDAVVEEMRI